MPLPQQSSFQVKAQFLLSDKVLIYSDGGAKPNPDGPGGWAAVLIYGDVEKEISGGAPSTTNNRMELTAACEALEALNRPCEVEFYTDSEYVKNGITEWMPNWIKKGWRTSAGKPVLNQDLWKRLHEATQRHTITWKWVRGHAGNAYNERVDRLATAAREKIKNSR
jgi:ribonuclease HI